MWVLVAVDLLLGLDGRDNLVPQDDMVVALVLRRGAHKLDVDIAAGDRRVDAQRMVGAVDELIIETAPVDRRVHAELDVGDGEHMRRTLCDLEIGVEAGGIDRGRDLTDASAGLCLALAAGLVDDSGLIALLRSALTNDFVERELVAGVSGLCRRWLWQASSRFFVRPACAVCGLSQEPSTSEKYSFSSSASVTSG